MGIFDGASATISSIESSVSGAVSSVAGEVGGAITALSGGLASGLSAVTGGIGGALGSVGGILSTVNRVFKQTSNVKLPLKNPLFDYASYTYNIGFGILPDSFLHNPDSTYRAGKKFPLIAKSAHADPDNRINTPYGKFDFYIDDLTINSQIGHEAGNNTNAQGDITFTVTEPYSMGIFFIACQVAGQQVSQKNWRNAPFILSLEFRGNTETGQIVNIPKTSRYIPIKLRDIDMTVTETGAVYKITAIPWNNEALSNTYSKFKSDQAIKGSTVQQMLQTGEKSLQTVLNAKLKDIAKANGIEQPDEILILFPEDISSGGVGTGNSEEASSATVNPKDTATANELFKKLGVARNSNGSLAQAAAQCNAIGKAKMGFDEFKKGSAPVSKDNVVYNEKTKINERTKNVVNQTESDFKFRQDTDIPNAINQVILNSNFITDTFDPSNITAEGYRGWWAIDTQSYRIGAESEVTGMKPRLLVYRILNYSVHVSSAPLPVNTTPPGYKQLGLQAVKQYEYIYTGHNVDIKRFEINYKSSFSNLMSPDGLKGSQDAKTKKDSGGADSETPDGEIRPVSKGAAPSSVLGVGSSIISFTKTLAGTDNLGGGGVETQQTRAARLFHDAINRGQDMMILSMEIIGDPYYLAQSGTGNYTAQPTEFYNLNDDGSVSYQNGEVDIMIKFRTPIDINQTTGLYNFGGQTESAPVMGFSGLYKVNTVTHKFNKGEFSQTLVGQRRPQQENPKPPIKAGQDFSTTKTVVTNSSNGTTQTMTPDEVRAARDRGEIEE